MPQIQSRFGQLKLIGRISLWFAAVAFAGLVGVVLLARPIDGDYVQMIRSLSASRAQLPLLMAVGGLLLTVGTALTTWLIALYSSFRTAGPLHRFCIDLEQGIRDGRVPHVRVRAGDHAQEDARYLEETARSLYRHYDELAGAIESAALQVRRGGETAVDHGRRIRQMIEQVKL